MQYGETPLHLAAKNGCTESVEMLLKHNADKEAKAMVSLFHYYLVAMASER